ncbi:MAG: hypothetical protein IRY99_12160 [Isosphaeraceae bacterium]|nr:hypothetical protein [Isosphaeraceae bacterium]
MWVEQAIYTSLPRDGKAGYHVVSRSRGVSDEDTRTLAIWSPSHGALLLDGANQVSVNFHPLADGRYALSRSCEGLPEYSGRGGRQIYTHALILERSHVERSGYRLLALYRDALALGHFRYRPDPDPVLEPVELGRCHRASDPKEMVARARDLGLGDLSEVRRQLVSGESIRLRFSGDRVFLAECLLDLLPREIIPTLSFSTSLQISSVRPYRLSILG